MRSHTFTRRALLLAIGAIILALGATAAVVMNLSDRQLRAAGASGQHEQIWTCPMHPEVREHEPGRCPKCGMELVKVAAPPLPAAAAPPPGSDAAAQHAGHTDAGAQPGTSPLDAPRTGLSIDTRRQQLIGVRTARVTRGDLATTIRTVGSVRYDETRLADVNFKLEGWIKDLYVDYTGQLVRRGQPLFSVYSPDLLATQNEYLLALKTQQQAQQSQIADAREYSGRLLDAARQRLLLWDLPPQQIAELERTGTAQATVVFHSPATGYVIEKNVLKGMRVMPGMTLYKVADLSVVWVEADLHESDMPYVRQGARARVTLEAYPGEVFNGRVIYVYPYVQEETRTARVRFEFPNRNGRLKPGMYANVQLDNPIGSGLTVPADAVIDSGAQTFVFVAQGNGYFEPRQVKVGHRIDGRVTVVAGLSENEEVAEAATFFIDSESQMRAALQSYQPSQAQPLAGAAAPSGIQVDLSTDPSPPRAGDTTFIAVIRDASGQPIRDASVSVQLYMPPMPSMNMPAMRSEARLAVAGAGTYRGTVNVLMSGRWDVTVTVSRGDQQIGTHHTTLVAR